MQRPKPLLQHRPIDKKKRQRQRDGAEMLVSIVDDLRIVCAILTETDCTIDDYALQRVYASNEWQGIADLCKDAPKTEEVFTWDWKQIRRDGERGVYNEESRKRIDLMPMTQQTLIENINRALGNLTHAYNTRQYENPKVYEMIKEIYDSEAFCQVTQPLLSNPQLANAYKRELQASRKYRKGTRLPEKL